MVGKGLVVVDSWSWQKASSDWPLHQFFNKIKPKIEETFVIWQS
jgi:hypothetical protein